MDMLIYKKLLEQIENIFYADNAGSRDAVGSVISEYDLDMGLFFLSNSGAETIDFFDCSSFVALAHTDLTKDICDLPNFRHEYSQHRVELGAIGSVKNIIFFTSSEFSPFFLAGSRIPKLLSSGTNSGSEIRGCDVYSVVFVSKDSYGLRNMANPNSLWRTVTSVVLNQRGIVSLEVACSAI